MSSKIHFKKFEIFDYIFLQFYAKKFVVFTDFGVNLQAFNRLTSPLQALTINHVDY